jgi:hypothetical protein
LKFLSAPNTADEANNQVSSALQVVVDDGPIMVLLIVLLTAIAFSFGSDVIFW